MIKMRLNLGIENFQGNEWGVLIVDSYSAGMSLCILVHLFVCKSVEPKRTTKPTVAADSSCMAVLPIDFGAVIQTCVSLNKFEELLDDGSRA